MYRNVGNQGRGNPTYTNRNSGSSSVSLGCSSTSTTQQEQKYTMAGSSQFPPNLSAITTNQDLQWLVQPSLLPPPAPSQPLYPTLPGAQALTHTSSQPQLYRPGVIRASSNSTGPTRHRNEEHLTREELERRRVRRERNKLAAAKCRNRRRELTDTLQNETDQLEDEKSRLHKEISELRKEKEKLELVLEAHRPICKIEDSDSDSDPRQPLSSLGSVKIEPADPDIPGPSYKVNKRPEKPKPKITIPTKPTTSSSTVESESLHTPVLMSTPSLTPFTASLIFTYPSSTSDTGGSGTPQGMASSSHQGNVQQSRNPQPCGVAHRRSSSSGDQSDHSLHSPTILTL